MKTMEREEEKREGVGRGEGVEKGRCGERKGWKVEGWGKVWGKGEGESAGEGKGFVPEELV